MSVASRKGKIFLRRDTNVPWDASKEFLEFIQLREALEVLGTRLAVPQITRKDLQSLYDLQQRMKIEEKRDGIDGFFRLNTQFHVMFVDRAHNKYLKGLYAQLMDHYSRYRLKSLKLRKGIAPSVKEHEAILNAIEQGDPDEAARLMAEHIRVPRQVMEQSTNR